MMKRKKIATRRFSNFESSIVNSARNYSSNGLCLILSFFRNRGILSSLFFLKTCENFRSGFKVSSCSHRSSFTIIIIAYQCDACRCLWCQAAVRDVDRREAIQVSAVCFCPSVGLVRMSILFILLPPDYNGALIVFPCTSSGIHCCPIISLPLSFAVFLTSWVIHSCKVRRDNQSLESGFDPCRTQTPQEHKVNPPASVSSMNGTGWCWTFFVQLDVAHFMDDATGFLAEYHWVFWLCQILENRFSAGAISWFFRYFFWMCPILSSSFRITSCAIPSILRSSLNSGCSVSTSDSVRRFSFLKLNSSGLTVGLPCSSLCTSFLVREDALWNVSCCCCCCSECQALLSTRLLFWECTLKMQSVGTELYATTAWDLVCQNRSPLSCARAKLIQ